MTTAAQKRHSQKLSRLRIDAARSGRPDAERFRDPLHNSARETPGMIFT
jgi:hypothetical protein